MTEFTTHSTPTPPISSAANAEALRNSAALMQAALDAAQEGIVALDLRGAVTCCNERMLQLWNVPKELPQDEILHFVFEQLVDRPACENRTRYFDAHPLASGMDVLAFKDGRTFQCWTAPQTVDGTVIGRVWTFHDITEQKRAEEKLVEQRHFLELLINHMPNQIFWKDCDLVYQGCNSEFARVVGLSDPKLVIGRTELDFPRDSAHEATYRAWDQRVIETGEAVLNIVEEYCDSEGHRGDILTSKIPLKDSTGKTLGVLGFCVEVTERKRMETALGNSERRFLGIANNLPGVVYQFYESTSGERGFHYMSGRATDIFGVSVEPLPTFYERFTECLASEDKQRWLASIEAAVRTRSAWNFEGRFIKPSGESRCIKGSSQPMPGESETLWNGYMTDVTEHKQAETEREQLQAQLNQAQKLESLGRLAGGVAHEFNNMLGAMLGHTDLALMSLPPDHLMVDSLHEIRKAAQRSVNITRQLLALARKQVVAPKVIDLNETVRAITQTIRQLIGEHITLSFLPSIELWKVNVDPSQVDQIIVNLCLNARDAIQGTGNITIETRNVSVGAEDGRVELSEFTEGDYVVMAVSDDGCGIDDATLANIFEPFFTTKEAGQGTGLGLATVYGIAKQNKGSVKVFSRPAIGSTFEVYLPRWVGSATQTVHSGAPKALQRGTGVVLLVEDEPAMLRVTRSMLEVLGYEVLTASTPSAAVRQMGEQSSKIDLLITDVVLPEMNGSELAKLLKALRSELKVMYVSGYTPTHIAHLHLLEAGTPILQKPFSIYDLADKVREAFDQ